VIKWLTFGILQFGGGDGELPEPSIPRLLMSETFRQLSIDWILLRDFGWKPDDEGGF
jgi:hypothetical protein